MTDKQPRAEVEQRTIDDERVMTGAPLDSERADALAEDCLLYTSPSPRDS